MSEFPERIPCQVVVRHKKTGKMGVTVEDRPPLDVCGPEETPVVFEGTTCVESTLTKKLEVIGPENAVVDPEKCGQGQGKLCCIFMVATRDGFGCQRYGLLRDSIIFRSDTMHAQRHPVKLYPRCQLSS